MVQSIDKSAFVWLQIYEHERNLRSHPFPPLFILFILSPSYALSSASLPFTPFRWLNSGALSFEIPPISASFFGSISPCFHFHSNSGSLSLKIALIFRVDFPRVLTLEDCSMSRQSLNLEQMWWAPSQFQDTSRKWGVSGGILLEYFLGRSPSASASASANEGSKRCKT